MRSQALVHLIAVFLVLLVSDVRAEETTGRRIEIVEQLPVDLAAVDLAVPASPAFTALDYTPETITRPSSPRQFALDVLSGLDPNGNFQVGVAIDTVPWLLLRGNELTIRDYETSLAQQLASRFQVSIATTKGTDSDDEALRLALGFRETLLDRGDPRLDSTLRECLKKFVIPNPEDFSSLGEYGAALDIAEAEAEVGVEACHEEAKGRLWNATAWDVGAAPTWIQESGTNDHTEWGGATFWSSFAYGFEDVPALTKTSQLVMGLRYRLQEQAPDPDLNGEFFEQDTLLAGARLRIGRPNLSVSFEGSYVYEDPKGRDSESAFRGGISSDFRIPGSYQLWLSLGLGATVGLSEGDRVFIMGAVKWGGQTFNAAQILNALRPQT